jgi:hypothetical protein
MPKRSHPDSPGRRDIRLSLMILEAVHEEKSFEALKNAINAAAGERGVKGRVDYRTLKKIVETPEKVNFSVGLMEALDAYFARKGKSLKDVPFFVKPSVVDCLLERRKLCFLLGAKERAAHRNDLSRWDTRSLALLLSAACKSNDRIEYELEDVVYKPKPAGGVLDVVNDGWYKLLQDDSHSVISFGSPRASPASEYMLATMFSVTPYERPAYPFGLDRRPPFAYAWLRRGEQPTHSAFALDARQVDLMSRSPRTSSGKGDYLGFFLDGQLFDIPTDGHQWTMYGVIAAQRRPAGNVWLVISGISGPATFAAARLVREIGAEVPWPRAGRHPVLWVPIRADITAPNPTPRSGDVREVVAQELIGDLREWPVTDKS